jgi:hypothetical protein
MALRSDRNSPPLQDLVDEILNGETWYQDGSPMWKGAPSAEQAADSSLRVVKRLRRFSGKFSAAKALADRLSNCNPDERCKSGACPECTRALQRWFVRSARRLVRDLEPADELITVSIVFPNGRSPVDTLDTLDTVNWKEAVARATEDSSIVDWIVGGLDISLNDDTQKHLGTGWHLQLYGIALVKDRAKLLTALRRAFPSTDHVSRPVQTKVCDGSRRAVIGGLNFT